MSGQWKQHERDVRDILGLEMTTREWASTSGVPQPDGDLLTAGTWLDGLHVEAKRHKRLLIPEWVRDLDGKEPWLLVVKRWGQGDPGRSYAVTDLQTVEGWLRQGYESEGGEQAA